MTLGSIGSGWIERRFALLRHPRVQDAILPLLLAAFGAFWSLRGAAQTDLIFPDAPRHALNGALLLDLVRDHALTTPVAYAHRYYSRLPAISLPYHPPLFPLFEALLFAMLGVSVLTARIAIAISVVVSCLLLYRLVLLTHGVRLLAASVVLAFLALPSPRWLASDVMLEFPSLVLVLAALLCLRELEFSRLRPALWFACLGIAAVWTKQQAVFLVGVPFVYAAIRGRWSVFGRKAFWISAVVLAAGAAACYTVSLMANASTSTKWVHQNLAAVDHASTVVWNRLRFYGKRTPREIGLTGTVLFTLTALWFAIRRSRDRFYAACDLYAAAIVCLLGLLAFMPFAESRYLFHVLPAIVAIVFTFLYKAGLMLFPERYAWTVPAAVTVLAFGSFARPAQSYTGPLIAARAVSESGTKRVLYCGEEVGSYVFDTRVLDSHRAIAVIRGDKLPAAMLSSHEFFEFLQKYGIERVVVELDRYAADKSTPDFCRKLAADPPPELVLDREIPTATNQSWLSGRIRIYRGPKSAEQPSDLLSLPSTVVKGGVEIDLGSAQ